MGFYFRKSVRVGPLRFNFSKSGIGVSTGIPGLRIGTGPRGHYIQAGRGGFYYRSTLPSAHTENGRRHAPGRAPTPSNPRQYQPLSDSTLGPMEEIESGSILALTDETSEGLLRELNDKRARWRAAPFVAGAGMVLLVLMAQSRTDVVLALLAALIGIATIVAWQWDALRKTTVIMYDMEPDALAQFESLVGALRELGHSDRIWHVGGQADVRDKKYHAGATSVIARKAIAVVSTLPPFVKCNIDVPAINVGRQTLYFFPDRVLVFDSGVVGAVAYNSLRLHREPTRFIEEEGVPRDSQVVGQTWRYVNKKGGPDRRFKDNRQLPICEYEALHLSSDTGLNELLHVSRVGAGASLVRLVEAHRQIPAFSVR